MVGQSDLHPLLHPSAPVHVKICLCTPTLHPQRSSAVFFLAERAAGLRRRGSSPSRMDGRGVFHWSYAPSYILLTGFYSTGLSSRDFYTLTDTALFPLYSSHRFFLCFQSL